MTTVPSRTAARSLWRNLTLDMVGAVGLGIAVAVASVFLPTIARREGLSPVGLAVLNAGYFVGLILSVFAGQLGPRSPFQLAVLRVVGAGMLVAVPLAPTPAIMVATSVLFWTGIGFANPFQVRLWNNLYPSRVRGRVVGFLGTGRSAAALLATLVGGVLADRIGGANLVGLGGLIGAVSALSYAGLRAPSAAASAPAPPRYSARESLRAIGSHPTLARVMLAQTFLGGGLIAAGPQLAFINVDRLDLSLTEVGLIGVIGSVATTVTFLVWGAAADRFGPLVPLRLGSVLGVVGLLVYTLAFRVEALWFAIAALGASNAAMEIGMVAAVSEATTPTTRAPIQSGLNALLGVRALAFGLVAGTVIQLGLLSLNTALLVCSGISVIGAVLYMTAPRPVRPILPEPGPAQLVEIEGGSDPASATT